MSRISVIVDGDRHCIICGALMFKLEDSWTDGKIYVGPVYDCPVCIAEEIITGMPSG